MADRPRVVMLTCELEPIYCGGMGAMVATLCRALDRTAVQPVVVLPRSGQIAPWPSLEHRVLPYGSADRHDVDGLEVWLLSNPVLDSAGIIYPEPFDYAGIKKTDEYGERVAELLVGLAPDLLHLHDAYGYKCLYQARRLGLPTVLTIHRLHEDEPPLAFAELAAVHLVDTVTTVSDAYRVERSDFFAARSDVEVIPNGIDLAYWHADDVEPRAQRRRDLLAGLGLPERPTFAFVGRLDRDQKGVDVLLAVLERAMAGAPYNLVIAGTGDVEIGAQLTAAAGRHAHVRFLHRMLARDEVRAMFAAVDAAIIPSRYEPFGLILVEAMAMGAIPIASRVGGLGEVLDGAGCGRSCAPGDVAGFADAIAELAAWFLTAPDAVTAARSLARARAEAFSMQRMAARYAALYAGMLGRRVRSAA